jgi:hypothetical protein
MDQNKKAVKPSLPNRPFASQLPPKPNILPKINQPKFNGPKFTQSFRTQNRGGNK